MSLHLWWRVERGAIMKIFDLLLNINFLINLILAIIFIEISFVFFQKIFKEQITKKNHLFYIFINTACFLFGNLLGNCIYAYSFMLVSSLAFMIYALKLSDLKVLSYFNFVTILVFHTQCLIFNLLSYHSYLEMITLPACNVIVLAIVSIFYFIANLGLRHLKLDNLFVNSINKNSTLIIGISLFNLLIIYSIFYAFFELVSQNIFCILTLDFYFYVSFSIIIYLCCSNYWKIKINNLQLCNKTVLNLYDNTRAFKHDFRNILQAIGGYIPTNDMDGLKKYYAQVAKECNITNTLSNLNPEVINNPAIYNILANKYDIASTHNIDINLEVMLDLNNLHMNLYELTRILGILLDNAIEASKECNEKSIHIVFKQDQYKQMLTVENTYNNKQICIDKIFEKDYTTKPHNTGLGLWEVRKILKKNSNLNLHTTKNNDYFSQQLEIYSA